MKVLIAYDGSDCSKSAMQDLRRAGLPAADTEAQVLSVADLLLDLEALARDDVSASAQMSGMVREARALARDAVANSREIAAEGAGVLASHFPRWRITERAACDTPYSGIVRRAEEWGADLVVVGSHGRSALGRLVLGSVAQKVLAYAPCSVRIGRCDVRRSPIPLADEPIRLLLAVDASPDAATAVDAVRSRPWPAGTQVRVVTSVDLKMLSAVAAFGADLGSDLAGDAAGLFRRRVDAVARDLREAGLTADTAVLEGDPKRSLFEHAEQWRVDSIFLGAKGHNRFERLLLGSVSASVAARAHCSVEVVRAGA